MALRLLQQSAYLVLAGDWFGFYCASLGRQSKRTMLFVRVSTEGCRPKLCKVDEMIPKTLSEDYFFSPSLPYHFSYFPSQFLENLRNMHVFHLMICSLYIGSVFNCVWLLLMYSKSPDSPHDFTELTCVSALTLTGFSRYHFEINMRQ